MNDFTKIEVTQNGAPRRDSAPMVVQLANVIESADAMNGAEINTSPAYSRGYAGADLQSSPPKGRSHFREELSQGNRYLNIAANQMSFYTLTFGAGTAGATLDFVFSSHSWFAAVGAVACGYIANLTSMQDGSHADFGRSYPRFRNATRELLSGLWPFGNRAIEAAETPQARPGNYVSSASKTVHPSDRAGQIQDKGKIVSAGNIGSYPVVGPGPAAPAPQP